MLELNEYKYIKEVKGRSPFTSALTIQEYIDGVKWRLGQWYGVDYTLFTEKDVYIFLKYLESTE